MIFKKLDIYLASNKPEIWISKIHKLAAYFLIALVIEIIWGILLPISIDTLPVMLIVSAVSICVIIYWFRNQIRSFDQNLSTRELLKVFLLNIAGFMMLSLLI